MAARVDEVRTACFGGGEARVGFAARTTSAWSGVDAITLTCDGEARTMPLAAPLELDAITLRGAVDTGPGAVIAAVLTGAAE